MATRYLKYPRFKGAGDRLRPWATTVQPAFPANRASTSSLVTCIRSTPISTTRTSSGETIRSFAWRKMKDSDAISIHTM